MSSGISGDMVFDTSSFVELIDLTPEGKLLKNSLVSDRLSAYISEINLSEVVYLLCRRIGYEKSISTMKSLIDTQYFEIEPSASIYDLAGRYKCERSLSICECYSLALGKYKGLPVLFARRESELEREMKRKPFDVKIIFLEEG